MRSELEQHNLAKQEKLDTQRIYEYLGKQKEPFDFWVYETLDSTNTQAKRKAAEGAKEGTVILAESQTEGRGRNGRKFVSPCGTGIYMTLILRPLLPRLNAALFTAAAAVAVAEAIEAETNKECGIKWVNDVFLGSKKVCGILAESALKAGTANPDYVIVGIGINVVPPKGGYGELKDVIGAVFTQPIIGMREKLIAGVLTRFWKSYLSLEQKTFYNAYRKRLFLLGREVTVYGGGEPYEATAIDLECDFSLRLRTNSGEERVLCAGEVSVKQLKKD